jgi:hypothetical protein
VKNPNKNVKKPKKNAKKSSKQRRRPKKSQGIASARREKREAAKKAKGEIELKAISGDKRNDF